MQEKPQIQQRSICWFYGSPNKNTVVLSLHYKDIPASSWGALAAHGGGDLGHAQSVSYGSDSPTQGAVDCSSTHIGYGLEN